MHDEAAAPLLAPLPSDERFSSWHLALGDGSLTGRGKGLVELLRSMKLTRPAAAVVAVVPASVLERLYDVVAAHRSRLGSLVPRGRAPRRFP